MTAVLIKHPDNLMRVYLYEKQTEAFKCGQIVTLS